MCHRIAIQTCRSHPRQSARDRRDRYRPPCAMSSPSRLQEKNLPMVTLEPLVQAIAPLLRSTAMGSSSPPVRTRKLPSFKRAARACSGVMGGSVCVFPPGASACFFPRHPAVAATAKRISDAPMIEGRGICPSRGIGGLAMTYRRTKKLSGPTRQATVEHSEKRRGEPGPLHCEVRRQTCSARTEPIAGDQKRNF